MTDSKTITLTGAQYQWVMAIANDTYKDACQWLYDTVDDGSEQYQRQARHNSNVRDMAEQVMDVKPNA
jgi:hypothetical protein